MINYVAYKLGGRKPYPVTQIRWQDKDNFVFFDGRWYHTKECVVCADTGYRDSKGKIIYEGDILQLNIPDSTCYNKGKLGIVSFHDTRFSWSPVNGWESYSLAGKSWIKLGNVACDADRLFSDEQIKKNYFVKDILEKVKGYFIGVMFEKQPKKFIVDNSKNELTNTEIQIKQSEKSAKKLLHQYKNYLKIKNMIDKGEIYPDILDSNLGLIKSKEEIAKDNTNT